MRNQPLFDRQQFKTALGEIRVTGVSTVVLSPKVSETEDVMKMGGKEHGR